MTRFGLRLTLLSGREALVRLVITVSAVAIGVMVLLSVLAEYHAFQLTSRRPSWESTQPMSGGTGSASDTELWNFSENIYRGQFIERLVVAPLGPNAPILPGLAALPKAGEMYASPALAQLLRTTPQDELGARFPGTLVGTIGQQALTGPQELVAIIGSPAAELAKVANSIRVDHINTEPHIQGTTNLYRLAFGIGAIAVLFPLLILIGTATRLSAARREERYAAIRLVGGTPGQINVIASIDALVAGVVGTLVGIMGFQLLRPALANVALSGARFFPRYVTPTVGGYLAMLILVPLGAAIAALRSLRRVHISPLGVVRKTTPPPPRVWRLLPLLVGIPLFVVQFMQIGRDPENAKPGLAFVALLLIMAGLVVAGPWLTMQASRLTSKLSHGASSLLAARRLGDDPKASFRSVGGLVVAVFIGTGIAVLAPAINAAQAPTGPGSLGDVLRVPFVTGPLGRQAARAIVARVDAYPGVTLVPIYANPAFQPKLLGPPSGPSPTGGAPSGDVATTPSLDSLDSVVGCTSLEAEPALGSCPPGASSVALEGSTLVGDNPLQIYKNLPLVTASSPRVLSALNAHPLSLLLVRTNDSATLEQIRTFLTRFEASLPRVGTVVPLEVWESGAAEPETFSEVATGRNDDVNNVERVVLVVLGLTLLVAGCSLAVTVAGSLVERKRPFTLLRVSGTPTRVLRRVVVLEAVVPLLVAALVAAVSGGLIAVPVVRALVPKSASVEYPGPVYYLTMGLGFLFAITVILATLPLLGRMTRTENARFE